MMADPLRALFYPFESGLLRMPDKSASMLFINARNCSALTTVPQENLTVQQYFKPWENELEKAGYKTLPKTPQDKFDAIFLVAPHQHTETLYTLATALNTLKPGGLLVAAAANDEGGRRLKKDAQTLGLTCTEESKYKSRIIWGKKESIDEKKCADAITAGSYQKICGDTFISCPGIFSWNEIDPGSAMLATAMPDKTLTGRGADFGCGFGFLSAHALKNNPGIQEIFCIDADARAVEACTRNISSDKAHFLWADIRPDNNQLPQNLDWIIMNPPFHRGTQTLPEAGITFIKAAQNCLRPNGQLWIVANTHLPYEKALSEAFSKYEKIKEDHGFKIFKAG